MKNIHEVFDEFEEAKNKKEEGKKVDVGFRKEGSQSLLPDIRLYPRPNLGGASIRYGLYKLPIMVKLDKAATKQTNNKNISLSNIINSPPS